MGGQHRLEWVVKMARNTQVNPREAHNLVPGREIRAKHLSNDLEPYRSYQHPTSRTATQYRPLLIQCKAISL